MYAYKCHLKKLITFIVVALCTIPVHGGIFDNRTIPLIEMARIAPSNTHSVFDVRLMASTANKATGELDKEVSIPDALYGLFDLGLLGRAFTATGRQNPLPDYLQGQSLPYRVEEKIQMQGINFFYYQRLCSWLSASAHWIAMRVNSHQEFFINSESLVPAATSGLLNQIDDIRREMFTQLGIVKNQSAQVDFGDISAYLRFGREWNYTLKMRHIDAGIRTGIIIPTGACVELDAPASIAFGGNGQWGVFAGIDAAFEIKEDIKAGFLAQVIKRIARTRQGRMSALGEPTIFGTIVGPLYVDKGVTLVCAPYFFLENIRGGLGLGLQYTLTKHYEDHFRDERIDKAVPATFVNAFRVSDWASDYFTFTAVYDFAQEDVGSTGHPMITFCWDIPSTMFVSKQVPKTHKISLGFEFSF